MYPGFPSVLNIFNAPHKCQQRFHIQLLEDIHLNMCNIKRNSPKCICCVVIAISTYAVFMLSANHLKKFLVRAQGGGRVGMAILHHRPSLQENLVTFPTFVSNTLANMTPTCDNANQDFKSITDSIQRTLNFYETHIDIFNVFDSAVGLQVLQGILEHSIAANQAGQSISREILKRITPLINRIFEQGKRANPDPEFQRRVEAFGKSLDLWKRQFKNWKPLSYLTNKREEFHNIGNEKDTVLSEVNALCQAALLYTCDVPDLCKLTFLDPVPKSQYMLTHQGLYLVFAKHKSCVNIHPDIFKRWEIDLENQCAKMLLEGEFIAKHGFPFWGRDLLAEQIVICGLAGYPNFLRQDWIQEMISWQSTSSSGCFLNPAGYHKLLDDFLPRRLTEAEKLKPTSSIKTEFCLPHLTSMSLSVLALKWAWLRDNCSLQ